MAKIFYPYEAKSNQHQAQRIHSPLIGEGRDAGVVPPTSAEKVNPIVLTYCF